MESIDCRLCEQSSGYYFTRNVLNRHLVAYYRCSHCGLIQTEEVYWLAEAYESAITSLDLGLVYRNELYAPITQALLGSVMPKARRMLDYGGGYGLFVRMMRDRGFDFYRQDNYCSNLFAPGYDLDDDGCPTDFDLLTAFEVFEHLADPMPEFEKMFSLAPNILFSTQVQPLDPNPEQWEYYIFSTGQHVALYARQTLAYIAHRFNKHLVSNSAGTLHLFTEKPVNERLFHLLNKPKLATLYNWTLGRRPSLLSVDYARKVNRI